MSRTDEKTLKLQMEELQLKMLRSQQALWATGQRAVVVFEGFDAAGKGTCIRHLVEGLDPRSIKVVPIGKPLEHERGQHYLQRFWQHLPAPGTVTIFDRSWYGRVLVEKVEELAPKRRLAQAYGEINAFEQLLRDDGIVLVKIFLRVSKDEQLKRFRARLEDPFKNWKITEEDVRNRKKWDKYVAACKVMFRRCPGWTIIDSDDKPSARREALLTVTKALREIRRNLKTDRKRLNKLHGELFNSSAKAQP